jgi:hypothetical protein
VFAAFVFLALLATTASARVQVRLHVPPPGRLGVEDLWAVELYSREGVSQTVWLEGHVSEARQGEVFRARSNRFELNLAPGERRTIRYRDIRVEEPWYKRGFEAFYRRTGTVPEGDYTYWVLLQPDLGGDTGRVRVNPSGPPRLQSPLDKARITERNPRFGWLAPMPPVPGVSYELRVVLVLRGQTPEEAMMVNPPVFAAGDLRTTSLVYPRSARPLAPGARYAWQVRALDRGAVIGSSAIWSFWLVAGGAGPGPIPSNEIYFCDGGETKGAVYKYTGIESKVYQRPANRIYSFCFAPWDRNRLYFVDANQFNIYVKRLSPGAPTESIVYTHTTYVRDIYITRDGAIYFSEATGAGGDGKIWRLNTDGTKTLYFNVQLSRVGGFWSGDFSFDPSGVLYLSTGNRVGSSIYRVDVAANTVTPVYTIATEAIAGFTFGPDSLVYYGDWGKRIYRLDLESGIRTTVYNRATRKWLSDVGFRPSETGVTPPGGVGNWVLAYGVGGTTLERIDTFGLTDYTEGGLVMNDAPFGSHLGFRSGSSSAIPTTDLYYYRWEYKHDGEAGWHDFDENVVVHYVKEVPGEMPSFPTYKLGPNPVGGKNLYQFRPHDPPAIPGAVTYWPTGGFLGDIYSGFLNTVSKSLSPGRYLVRLSVFDSLGNKTLPGAGTFRFLIPTAPEAGGTIPTRLALPAEIVDGGVRFYLHVDNRPCSAYIAAPTIGGTPASDTCGFLRYDPVDPSPVSIAFHASHPDSFAVFTFRIYRGIFTVDSSLVAYPEVGAATAGVYASDGHGNFGHDFKRSTLLGPCTEAALSENLYVYAKATTGWSTRISGYDRSFVRAFALAEKKP